MADSISDDQCALIEQECGLTKGTLAPNREMTAAEKIYLYGLCPHTELAFYVDLYQGASALIIYDCGTLDDRRDEWDPLEGTAAASRDLSNIQATWAGLHLVRQSGLRDRVGEDMAVVMTLADLARPELHHRWSFSVCPGQIRAMFTYAPRPALLRPTFVKLPPKDEKGPSPGMALDAVSPPQIFVAQSILFQGASSCLNHDGPGLLRVAVSLQSSIPTLVN